MNATALRRQLAPLALMLLAPLALAQPGDARRSALVIGPRVYESKNLPALPYAGADAHDVAQALAFHGYKVTLMNEGQGARDPNAAPTLANIRGAIRDFTAGKGKRDQLVFAFIGHGVRLRVGGRDVNFLCPRDAKVRDPRTMVGLDELFRDLDASKAGSKLLLLDASHPGAGGDVAAPLDSERLPPLPRGMSALFANTGRQPSVASDRLGGHGAFAFALLEVLSGRVRDDDGDITWGDLTEHALKRVPRVAREIDARAKQTPHLVSNLAGASPVLFRYRAHARTVTNSIDMKFARIPAGSFIMGAPKEEGGPANEAQHRVSISRPYYLGAFEVTQAQYRRVMGTTPSHFAAGAPGAEDVRGLDTRDFPVEQVTWAQAVEFCEKLSRLPAEKKAGRRYRLPTEAEWEYACRAGTTTAFAFGDTISSKLANFHGVKPYRDAEEGPALNRTAAVGSYKPNAWGLYDMHGNVWEWCSDFYSDTPPPGRVVDPAGPARGTERVIRGGSHAYTGMHARSARRSNQAPDTFGNSVGFRVLLAHP